MPFCPAFIQVLAVITQVSPQICVYNQHRTMSSVGTIEGKEVTFSLSNRFFSWIEHDSDSPERVLKLNQIIAIIPYNDGSRGDHQLLKTILYLDRPLPSESGGEHGRFPYLRTFKATAVPDSPVLLKSERSVPPYFQLPVANNEPNIHVLISTHSGSHDGVPLFENLLKPMLPHLGVTNYQVHKTESAQTVTELTETLFNPRARAGIPQTIILLSGDGGLVDIIKVLSSAPEDKNFVQPTVVLIPVGTGNATANSTGLLGNATLGLSNLVLGVARDLPTFGVTLSPDSVYLKDEGTRKEPVQTNPLSNNRNGEVYGAVVVSWGLHSSLVADSDNAYYRKFGAERFKMAAQELLNPSDGSGTHQYKGRITLTIRDPDTGEIREEALAKDVHMYVLITMVSQLEKGFTISPLSEPLDGKLRFVHFEPLDPERAMRLMGLAYEGGKHVSEAEVDYQTVESVKIQFNEDEEKWRRVCVDGTIIVIRQGGWLEVKRPSRGFVKLVVPETELETE